jgi:hypothetical protein
MADDINRKCCKYEAVEISQISSHSSFSLCYFLEFLDSSRSNDAVDVVAVMTSPFLSHLQHLVIVKVRRRTPTPALPRRRWREKCEYAIEMIVEVGK